ncbi:MAG: hypothetical protein RL253_484, partial [Bacteroidota bacterium]
IFVYLLTNPVTMNYRTYELIKEGKVINQTEAQSADSALDYFILFHEDIMTSKNYQLKTRKFSQLSR